MSDLLVIAFDDEATAFETRAELVRMQQEYLLQLEDAVVVTRPEGQITLHQAVNLTAAGAVGGTMWGALVGLIFLNPLVGAAVGAGAGALAGRFTDVGINDDFIRDVSNAVPPGGSAVFLLIRKMTTDKVVARLQQFSRNGRILRTSLSEADEARLREAFAGDDLARSASSVPVTEVAAPASAMSARTGTATPSDSTSAAQAPASRMDGN